MGSHISSANINSGCSSFRDVLNSSSFNPVLDCSSFLTVEVAEYGHLYHIALSHLCALSIQAFHILVSSCSFVTLMCSAYRGVSYKFM
jgi:hypothetical protein